MNEYNFLCKFIPPDVPLTSRQIIEALSNGGHQGYFDLPSCRKQFFKQLRDKRYVLEKRPETEMRPDPEERQQQIEIITTEPPAVLQVKKEPVFSFYRRPVMNKVPTKDATISQVFKAITGDFYKEKTAILRGLAKADQGKYKTKNFDHVTFSGTFTERKEEGLKEYSGYIVIDLDELAKFKQDPELLKLRLARDKKLDPVLIFTSPRGDGLKMVVYSPFGVEKHRSVFKALTKYIFKVYGVPVDISGSDPSRTCFLSYDPNAYTK